jgi:hypothetical protein
MITIFFLDMMFSSGVCAALCGGRAICVVDQSDQRPALSAATPNRVLSGLHIGSRFGVDG